MKWNREGTILIDDSVNINIPDSNKSSENSVKSNNISEPKRDLMLELERLAEESGLRDYAKLGTQLDVSADIKLLIDSKSDINTVLRHDGSVKLTDDWDVGLYKITAEQIGSSASVGIAPLVIISTTMSVNLNADLLDGVHASALEPTVSKGNLTAGSTKITIGGTGTGSVIGAGVTVDVAQANLDHGSIGGLSDDDHTQYIRHSLAVAVSDFLVGAGTTTFTFVKKTLAEVKTILGLGSAAYTASSDYAVSGKGVTNGDSHDHVGGDGAQVDHGGLGGLSDDDHSQYLLAGGSRILSADWDIGDSRMIQTDKIRARDGDGLALYEDGGTGIFVKDGGNIGFGTVAPSYKVDVNGTINIQNGSELITNGTFASNITGWTDNCTSPDYIAWSASYGGSMLLMGSNYYAYADQAIVTAIGQKYIVSIEGKSCPYWPGTAIYMGTSLGAWNLGNIEPLDVGIHTTTFIAIGTTTYIRLKSGWNDTYFDNVSVFPISMIAAGNIDIGGDCAALTFTDKTAFYEGDALKEIGNIKGKNGELDHATLPQFVKSQVLLKTPITKEIEIVIDEKKIIRQVIITTEEGRNLSAMVTMQTAAIQQLLKRIELLEKT